MVRRIIHFALNVKLRHCTKGHGLPDPLGVYSRPFGMGKVGPGGQCSPRLRCHST